jgi:adenosylcobinamide-GDP ribazoletransferase
MTQAPRTASWRAAMTLFTVLPARGPTEIDHNVAGRLVVWFPAIGVLLGAVAGGGLLAVEASGLGIARRLLAATIAVTILGVLTGGLHLDGLADTADGLASRQPRDQALDIMRRSDIGPMGVSAVILIVLMQVFSLATLPTDWLSAVALVAAAVTGRVAVVLATGLPSARPAGFGALVAGTTTRPVRLTISACLLAVVAGFGAAAGGWPLAARGLAGVVVGLAAAAALQRAAIRRLGGTTGDVFGALVEVCTATVLVVFALLS